MTQLINNQTLMSTSKSMLFILRILFIMLILIIIIPWIAPTSKVGGFLLGMYGVPQYFGNKNFGDAIYNLSLFSRGLGFIGSFIGLLPLLAGTIIMIKLFKRYAIGNVFSLNNAQSYRNLGLIYLISALLLQPISQIFFSLCATINNPVGQRTIAFSIDVNNLTAIFFAIMLVVIGQVMKLGQKISEEQELTV